MGRTGTRRDRRVVGWLAVAVSTVIVGLWAFWGIIENFHEGWYHESVRANMAMLFGQYLSPMLAFLVAALVAVRWPWVGGALHLGAAGLALGFFRGAPPAVILPFLVLPLVLLGAAYGWGRPEPRRWALRILVGVPLLTLIFCGAEPAWRVAGRLDDGDRGARRVAGNGVELVWAPEGPGWPQDGVNWEEALRRVRYLSEDGRTLAEAPQDIWRLPSVEEVVRSQQRHGKPCGGTWDPEHRRVNYEELPDKESPLWDVHSKIIYWWTASSVDDAHAFIIVYNGQVWPRPKEAHWGYLGFRAVRDAGERTG